MSAKQTHVDAITHEDSVRTNIPTTEMQALVPKEQQRPIPVAFKKRDPDLDPQLIWRGKFDDGPDELIVKAPPLYIQEKIHPQALIEDLINEKKRGLGEEAANYQLKFFDDFNGIPPEADKTDFYKHEGNWTNRMILGDSLQVMASLAEREGLAGKVQAIYIDPPYGIRFNSNFQWSTMSRDVKDGKKDNFTREPEQVRAFRDTWQDGIHSYLTYLRDRLIVARELLTESGSIFVQIGDENVHHVREVMDEVFGVENFVSQITIRKTGGMNSPDAKLNSLGNITDTVLWYGRDKSLLKYRQLHMCKEERGTAAQYGLEEQGKPYQSVTLESNGYSEAFNYNIEFRNKYYQPSPNRHWSTTHEGMRRVGYANRIIPTENKLRFKKFLADFPVLPLGSVCITKITISMPCTRPHKSDFHFDEFGTQYLANP